MSQSEEKTIRKAAAGDRLAFRDLVLEHSHAMFRLAWRLSGDQTAADDIVQEAFIKAWQKVGDFRMDSSFRSWVSRITVNTAMDYLRKQSRLAARTAAEPEWERSREGSETPRHDVQIDIQTQTHAALMQLSEKERAALMLRHFEGHSIKEIAQMLDLTSNACKQTIFRAVRKMRIELAPLVTT
ncbi:MAG: RNA polymerase sigma factor [Xanthomonadales bacterium]|jgi:RNA polymerase sigma-70 factor (ECF subfamily)|nr:RNA polymerase sigma factor [Xanthomonadales bacterium]